MAADSTPRAVELTILHTNDIHGHLFPFDYAGNGPVEVNVGGAARRATMIRQIKQSAGHPVLVMDAGDVFTRGPIANLMGVPDLDVLNAVPYDVMTLGNNEFKGAPGLEGQRVMLDRIKQAKFPIVSANVIQKSSGKTIVPPYTVFEVDGVRVGVLGLTAPRVASYDQAQGLEIADPIETAKRVIPELRKQSDFVVALTHIGYALDLQLAAAAPEIDVIIGGDSHTWVFVPTLVSQARKGRPEWWPGGTVVCQDGEWGKCLGRLDLTLRAADGGRYFVSSYKGQLLPVDSTTKPAPDIERIIADAARPYMNDVGLLRTAVTLEKAPSWVAEIIRRVAKAQVGVVPNYTVENGLRAGRVTDLAIRQMFPFNNNISRAGVTGKQLLSFITAQDCGTAGVEFSGDAVFVDGKKIDENATYTLGVEEFFVHSSPALSGAKAEQTGISTMDAVTNFVSGKLR